MKNSNIKKLIILSTISAIMLTGCNKDKTTNITEKPQINTNQYQEEQIIETTEEPISQTEQQNSQDFNYFSEAKKELTEYIESDDFKKLKEQGKYYVTTGIDFIFFDKEINGVTFKELTTELKIRVMNDVAAIDSAVEAYYPNYKETLSEKYQVAAEFVSSKYVDIVESIKEYLGDENWNSLNNIKNQILGDLTTKKDEAIEDIKELYKTWSNK